MSDHPTHGDKADRRPPKRKTRRRTAERFGSLNLFLDSTAGALTRGELLTWLILYRDTKPDGTTKTAQADIARRAGVDARSVRRALDRLAGFGLVKIIRQGGFRQGASTYIVEPLPTRLPGGTVSVAQRGNSNFM